MCPKAWSLGRTLFWTVLSSSTQPTRCSSLGTQSLKPAGAELHESMTDPPPTPTERGHGCGGLTQRGPVGHQDVDAFGDQVPLVQQRLSSRQVEAPAVEPGGPAAESGAVRARPRPRHLTARPARAPVASPWKRTRETPSFNQSKEQKKGVRGGGGRQDIHHHGG